jgi:dihydrodipicolinate synthase/N-acetylneuraminate lyase
VTLRGLVPIVNTPFTADLDVDLGSVERLVAASIVDGASGFIVPAVASEVAKLSIDERVALLDAVLATVGTIPVIGGASSADPDETAVLLDLYARHRCRAVLIQIPPALATMPDAAVDHFRRLPLGPFEYLMIQDLDWSGPGATIEVIERLADALASFTCLKVETVPAGVKYSAVARRCPQLDLAGGWALPQMIEALDRGVSIFTTTAVNLPFRRVLDHYEQGRRDEAWAVFDQVATYLGWAHQHIDVSIAFLKRYCWHRGLFTTAAVRPPSLPYDEYHQRVGDELIDRLLRFEDRLRHDAAPELARQRDA